MHLPMQAEGKDGTEMDIEGRLNIINDSLTALMTSVSDHTVALTAIMKIVNDIDEAVGDIREELSRPPSTALSDALAEVFEALKEVSRNIVELPDRIAHATNRR